ncbi:MAG TPA: NUDIX domain-containing protein [Ktedonobacterales bacterium]|nr:NUDIX domain-containing protein [Ktedonobacterales bacterium]
MTDIQSYSQTQRDDPTPTHVVSCFVLRRDRGRDEILLTQRSQRVRTYRGAWAAISGYVEQGVTPLDQAYQELHEEANLERADLTLVREGMPLPFTDAAINQEWVVHPFLFVLHSEALDHLRTDWEATQSHWVSPDEIASLPTVPMLAQALARVYPPDEASPHA